MHGTWDAINSILHGCHRSANSSVDELHENGQKVCNLENICNVFNDYFVNIGNTLSSNNDNVSNHSFYDYLPPFNDHSMFLSPTDEVEVLGCIGFQSWS